MMNKRYKKKKRMSESDLFSDSEEQSDFSEYESDHEEYDSTMPYTDWKGKPVVFEERFSSTYPLSAYKFSRSILKRYKFNRRVAFEKTGFKLPITRENVVGQVVRIQKSCGQTYDRKPKLVFP